MLQYGTLFARHSFKFMHSGSLTEEKKTLYEKLPLKKKRLIEDYIVSFAKERNDNIELSREVERLRKEKAVIESTKSWKIGRAMTWLPRKVRGGIRCLKDNGLGYTIKLFAQKTRNKISHWKGDDIPRDYAFYSSLPESKYKKS